MACIVPEIHVDDVGTDFGVRVIDSQTGLPIDLDTATALTIKVRRPDGTTWSRAGTATEHESDDPGAPSQIVVVTELGDFPAAGDYAVQGIASFPTPSTIHTQIIPFRVYANL